MKQNIKSTFIAERKPNPIRNLAAFTVEHVLPHNELKKPNPSTQHPHLHKQGLASLKPSQKRKTLGNRNINKRGAWLSSQVISSPD